MDSPRANCYISFHILSLGAFQISFYVKIGRPHTIYCIERKRLHLSMEKGTGATASHWRKAPRACRRCNSLAYSTSSTMATYHLATPAYRFADMQNQTTFTSYMEIVILNYWRNTVFTVCKTLQWHRRLSPCFRFTVTHFHISLSLILPHREVSQLLIYVERPIPSLNVYTGHFQ